MTQSGYTNCCLNILYCLPFGSYTANVIRSKYLTGNRKCFYIDIFGQARGEDDDSLTLFTSRSHGKPCPKCGVLIEFAAGGGTKLYYCPQCQPK